MNIVVLIGRLTKDMELKYTPGSNIPVGNFYLAVERKNSKGKPKQADFIPCVIWGKLAESTAKYMTKGKLISLRGEIKTDSYKTKDGAKRYVMKIITDQVSFLSKSNELDNTDPFN